MATRVLEADKAFITVNGMKIMDIHPCSVFMEPGFRPHQPELDYIRTDLTFDWDCKLVGHPSRIKRFFRSIAMARRPPDKRKRRKIRRLRKLGKK